MQTLRKVFAISVIFVTVLSMSVVVGPSASAAASAGDLIKMSGLSSVYYLAGDGKRYVFPNESTYFSWYGDFSSVMTIPQSELEGYPLGANVTVRPGTKLVKITTNPSVYAVEPGGNLRKITSEAQATTLYGANWAKRVIDVSDAFFTNYKIGADLPSGVYPVGSLLKSASAPAVVYYDGTNYRSVASEAAFNGNRFKWSDIVTTTMAFVAGGTALSAGESTLTDTSSGAGGSIYTGGSGVTVSLSGATPVSTSVPQNGSRVPMAKLNLTASNDGAITVSSITVKRIGLSDYVDIDKVWAEKDSVIVASKKSMNSNDESILTFSPGLVISAGTTVTVDLLVSFGTAAGNIGLSVVSASSVSAGGATVSGSFPVNGNLMSPIAYTVTNLAITSTTSAAYAVKVGDEKVELGKFTVEFNGTAKDVTLTSIMLKNNGVEDLATAAMNLYLEYNGEKVSSSATVSGRFVTFYFPAGGFNLLKDDSSKILYVKGDVIAKENTASTGNFVFLLNKSTDFSAYEKATGFGVNVYNATTGSTKADNFAISTVGVSAGVITVSKKAGSPADTTIIKGSDNTVLLANIRADEAITADGLNLKYGSAAADASTVNQFENVRVWLNGVLLNSFDPSATSSSLISQLIDSTLTLNKGDNLVEVKVKAKTTAAASSAFLAKLDSANLLTSQNPEYVSSKNAVSSGDVSGTATGGIFTVQGATLTTVRNDGYALNKVAVQGALNVSVGKFSVKATNDTVKVTSVGFGANSSSTAASSIYDAKLFVDGIQVGNTVDFGGSGATFSTLNISIAKDTTKSFELKVSFDSSATGGFQTLMTVNAQDSRGTAVSSGNTANSQTFSIATGGTLAVALDGDTPVAALLAAKATEQEVAKYKFTAVNDSASLTEINFVNNASSTGVVATSSADSLISSIKLYNGATLIDSVTPVNGAGKFVTDGKTGALVSANGIIYLSVKVVLNPISNDADATNKDLQFTLTTVNFKSSSGTANGLQTENDKANSFRIRKTVPTVALSALPGTLLTAGNLVVSKFTVTADASGDVTLRKVVLTYATSSANVGLATLASNAVKVNGTTKDFAATVDLAAKTVTVDFGATTQEVITAGFSKTFEILATLSVSGTGAESITTSIVEDGAYATNGTGSFVWSDGASITADTYSNGKRVPGLTTNTQVLSK